MSFKIDTKEKFNVITPNIVHMSVNMADELITQIHKIRQQAPHNVIINLKEVQNIEQNAAEAFLQCRIAMYNDNQTFVICCCSDTVMQHINDWEMDESLNVVPTESEAWDIVQMDEIEREFLNDDDFVD
jgi:anti-anti-sigma regulatory factor